MASYWVMKTFKDWADLFISNDEIGMDCGFFTLKVPKVPGTTRILSNYNLLSNE